DHTDENRLSVFICVICGSMSHRASACTHSALVCINGWNASRGTVVSMYMLSSVLIFAPATAGPSLDSSHTNQLRTSASDLRSTRAISADIRWSMNLSETR